MEYVRFAVRFTAFALLVVVIGGYCYLVWTGDLPKPDFQGILQQIAPSLAVGGGAALGIVIGVCVFLTAVAPFVYAARSGDAFTVVVSIIALVVCFLVIASSRTIIDMVLAAIVYFTSALISVVVYSTTRIEAALAGQNRPRS
ncbi:hypothetical protein [Bradyrhizobium sp.]|uniref:hypothetical protein n=1 Tax=Bradyrhizobium sp. TaxID=376 RepID=UPI0039E46E94